MLAEAGVATPTGWQSVDPRKAETKSSTLGTCQPLAPCFGAASAPFPFPFPREILSRPLRRVSVLATRWNLAVNDNTA